MIFYLKSMKCQFTFWVGSHIWPFKNYFIFSSPNITTCTEHISSSDSAHPVWHPIAALYAVIASKIFIT